MPACFFLPSHPPMVVAYPSLIPKPFPFNFPSPFPQSPRNRHSLSFFVPSTPKGPSFRSKEQQRGLVSMALPSSSSSPPLTGTSDAEAKVPDPGVIGENDLLIIGRGVLGRIAAEKWRQDHPDSQIFGQTMTSDHHDELIEIGIKPSLRGSIIDNQYPYVIFCAPPSRTEDYPGDVKLAASNWSGEGSFLFTSSIAVHECCVAIMKKFRSQTFLGCDDRPLTRQEVMDCVKRSGKFSKEFQGFTGTEGPLGKRMNNSKTRAEVGWDPKYASFFQFFGLA